MVETYGGRLLNILEMAERAGVAGEAGGRPDTAERMNWRLGLLRQLAETYTRAGCGQAPERWRHVLELCRVRVEFAIRIPGVLPVDQVLFRCRTESVKCNAYASKRQRRCGSTQREHTWD